MRHWRRASTPTAGAPPFFSSPPPRGATQCGEGWGSGGTLVDDPSSRASPLRWLRGRRPRALCPWRALFVFVGGTRVGVGGPLRGQRQGGGGLPGAAVEQVRRMTIPAEISSPLALTDDAGRSADNHQAAVVTLGPRP